VIGLGLFYPAGTGSADGGLYPWVVADLGNGHPDVIGIHRFKGMMIILYGEWSAPDFSDRSQV
jgi:hypothetical protein